MLRAKAGQQAAAAGTRTIVCKRERQKEKVGSDSFTMAALAWMKLEKGCKSRVACGCAVWWVEWVDSVGIGTVQV